MADNNRLDDLTVKLSNFKAGPSKPIDFNMFKQPGWQEKLKSEGLPHLYEQFGEIFSVIQELCTLYAQASPEEQAIVRQMIAPSRDARNALSQYTPSLAAGDHPSYEEWRAGYATLKENDFDRWMRLLITALALQLNLKDYRDDIMAIQHLQHEAKQRDVDFEPYRQELIRLSDPKAAAQVGLVNS